MKYPTITSIIGTCLLLPLFCTTVAVVPPGETGWQSNDAFRVRAAGTPNAGEKNPFRKKAQARRAALIMSRIIVMESFTAQVLGDISDPEYPEKSYKWVLKYVKEEFQDIVSKGDVITEKYNRTGACLILYEVKSEHLRQSLAKLRNSLMVKR